MTMMAIIRTSLRLGDLPRTRSGAGLQTGLELPQPVGTLSSAQPCGVVGTWWRVAAPGRCLGELLAAAPIVVALPDRVDDAGPNNPVDPLGEPPRVLLPAVAPAALADRAGDAEVALGPAGRALAPGAPPVRLEDADHAVDQRGDEHRGEVGDGNHRVIPSQRPGRPGIRRRSRPSSRPGGRPRSPGRSPRPRPCTGSARTVRPRGTPMARDGWHRVSLCARGRARLSCAA